MHRKAAVCERKIKWQRQNKTELLAENQIHLWLIPLNELPITFSEGFCEGLTERERSRAEKILDESKRRLYSGGRIGLRLLLESYSGISREELKFIYGERGKPSLKNPPGRSRLEFNYTVSSDFALYAFSWNRDLGIDLEIAPRKIEADLMAKRILSNEELINWQQIPLAERNMAMLACWTRKEAYGKLMGVGIRYVMSAVDLFVELHRDSWLSRVSGLFDGDEGRSRYAAGVQIGLPVPGAATVMCLRGATKQESICSNNKLRINDGGIFDPELLGFMYSRGKENLR